MPAGSVNPTILALDSAGLACSVAVGVGETVRIVEHQAMPHGQAEALLPMVDRAMREASIEASALDLIAVTTGPGSFTGIRVGLAAARGIALALDVPLFGVTSFQAASAACAPDPLESVLLVALESRRADLFIQFFDSALDPIGDPIAVMPGDLAGIVRASIAGMSLTIAGDGAARAAAALAADGCVGVCKLGEPAVIGALRSAMQGLRRGERCSPARPLYLRPPDVTFADGRRAPGVA
jgi:tRNA threonylcarbamoyladenosine biosynthesis protein TsaB